LSAEVEQLRVNNSYNVYNDNFVTNNKLKDNFWNTAVFIGAGYSIDNVTVGIRYNILFNKDNFVYNEAWMPFIRFYF